MPERKRGKSAMRERWTVVLAAMAGLLLLTIASYWPALQAGFIWDDDTYVWRNYALQSFDGLFRIWTHLGTVPQYYPLTHTTFFIEHSLWGFSPFGYHVVNVLLHATSAILLWRLLRRLQVPGALAIAAIFAVHPVQAESVAWVTERKNVLAGLFYLLAFGVYWRMIERAKPDEALHFTAGRYTAALLLFVAALLSKTVSSSLPAALLLVIYWKRGRITWRDVTPLLPFFVIGAGMGMLTGWMEQTFVGASGRDWSFTIAQRTLMAGHAIWFYVWKLLFPVNLCFIYPKFDINPGRAILWIAPVAVVVAAVILWVARRRIGRGPLVAYLLFCGTLFPALGFVNVYPMLYSFVADHFQYMASIGMLSLLIAAIASVKQVPVIAKRVAAAAIVLVLSVLTFRQARIYENLTTLWTDTLAKNPDAWIAANNMAQEIIKDADQLPLEQQRQKAEQALPFAERALARRRDMQGVGTMVQIMVLLGRDEEALKLNHELLDDPGFQSTREWKYLAGAASFSVGHYYQTHGDQVKAEEWFRKAVELRPSHAEAQVQLASIEAGRGDFAGALSRLQQASELTPDSVSLWTTLGNVYMRMGQPDRAAEAFGKAIELKPAHTPARYGQAIAWASTGRLGEAEAALRELAAEKPDAPEILSSLGMVLAKEGRRDEAVQYLREALRVAPGFPQAVRTLEQLGVQQ